MLFLKWCLPNPDKFKKDISDTALPGRILSYSLKITNRSRTMYFFREILGMKILRHNEYSEDSNRNEGVGGGYGEARWSKTMVGYGPEDKFFALELIYNYPIQYYDKGNALICITIKSSNCLKRAKKNGWPIIESNRLEAPDGFKFQILDEPQPTKTDPIINIVLAVSKIKHSLKYWHDMLGMDLIETNIVGYNHCETVVVLKQIKHPIEHGDSGGRLSISLPDKDQEFLEYKLEKFGYKVVVPVVTYENDLLLLLLQDPDGHELGYYNKKGYGKIAIYSPSDEKILDRMLAVEKEIEVKDEPAKRIESRKILESMRRKQVSDQLLRQCENDLMRSYCNKFKEFYSKKRFLIKNISKDVIVTSVSSEDSIIKEKKSKSETNLLETNEREQKQEVSEKSIEEKSEDLNKTEDKSVLVMLTSATVIYKQTPKDESMTNTDSKNALIDLEDKYTETQNEEFNSQSMDESNQLFDDLTFCKTKLKEYRSKSPDPSRTTPTFNYSQVHRSKSRDCAGTWIRNDNLQCSRFDKQNVTFSKDVRKCSKPNIQCRTRTPNKNNGGIDSEKLKSPHETKKNIKSERKEKSAKHYENYSGFQKPVQQKKLNNEFHAKKDEKKYVKNTKAGGYAKEQYQNANHNKTIKLNAINLDSYQPKRVSSKYSNTSEEFICLTEMNVDLEEDKIFENLKNSFMDLDNKKSLELSDYEKARISDFKVSDLFIFNDDANSKEHNKNNKDDKFEYNNLENERETETINDGARIKQSKEMITRKSIESILKEDKKENFSAKLKGWVEQSTYKDILLESQCKIEKNQCRKVNNENKIIGDV